MLHHKSQSKVQQLCYKCFQKWYIGLFRLVRLQNIFIFTKWMPIASLIYPKLALNLFLTNILNELFPDSIKYVFIYVWIVQNKTKYVPNFFLVYVSYAMKIFEMKSLDYQCPKFVSYHRLYIFCIYYLLLTTLRSCRNFIKVVYVYYSTHYKIKITKVPKK